MADIIVWQIADNKLQVALVRLSAQAAIINPQS